MNTFRSPDDTLGTLDAPRAADVIGVAADISLVLDAEGIILDVCATGPGFVDRDVGVWIGRPWIDTVTVECREKVSELVSSESDAPSRQRQINQVFDDESSMLVVYSVVPLSADGHRIAVGKDLSSLTQLQQRLVNVQQSMERDYARLRQFETRYRTLFQSSAEAIVIADAQTLRVVEANPSACKLLGSTERKIVGSGLMRWFEESSRPGLEVAIDATRQDGKGVPLTLGKGRDAWNVNVSMFKTDSAGHLLLRLRDAARDDGEAGGSDHERQLAALIERAPDGLVVTGTDGRIVAANTEFLDLAQLTGADVANGQSLSNWLGQGGIDYQIIMASVREHGAIRLYSTRLRGEFGSIADVEVSAVPLQAGEVGCIGFAIRDVGRRVAANDESSGTGAGTPRSIDQLTQLVGRVPLKELVRESTELIEQLCIQAALKITNNNRASAAEMLGLSRQSLYVKLRRYALEEDAEGSKESGSIV